jgi:hypothetical protein
MGSRWNAGIPDILLVPFGVVDCVLHADEECMPEAIQ